MTALTRLFPIYVTSKNGSAVEFVLIFPFLFYLFLVLLDAGNYFADRRAANRLAESIVRTARNIDEAIATQDIRPLAPEKIQLLRNIAARLRLQLPEERNYVWLGRYVRPQNPDGSALLPVRQLLPDGLSAAQNGGLTLLGTDADVVGVEPAIATSVESIAQPGEIIYAVEIAVKRRFMTPLPHWLQSRLSRVRYIL